MAHAYSTNEIADDIKRRLKQLREPTTAAMRQIRREFSRRIAAMPAKDVLNLALRLRQMDLPDFFAFELLQHHQPAMNSMNSKVLEALGRGIDNWIAVDCFGCFVSGPVWREGLVPDSLIQRWARSKDRWWRRAAVVSTVPLNNKTRGGGGDAARTLRICEMLTHDRDDMVVKAMSWALRELSKRDSQAVKGFIQKHHDDLAPRVLREVSNKLETGLKNPNRNDPRKHTKLHEED